MRKSIRIKLKFWQNPEPFTPYSSGTEESKGSYPKAIFIGWSWTSPGMTWQPAKRSLNTCHPSLLSWTRTITSSGTWLNLHIPCWSWYTSKKMDFWILLKKLKLDVARISLLLEFWTDKKIWWKSTTCNLLPEITFNARKCPFFIMCDKTFFFVKLLFI